ncbi:MAG: 5-bromo-4-chloroindolyl phosphate hydrolysis family protein [Salibaculum sp.]|uniref:5-bromo-4-chloroindolyl phosphate hydrolysis family protein n=1 Tax=Salibaculum sp. TaxID=2855480 RepID=UPI002870B152|nr:5-bromo-4-chloroindolyl phosphate hydrolysis family protein [Salibaculum sp.]MDR9428493.1 5-bromo-4-chloroindolyl phosphate hydrolysis family protein [Salibaculum sp.]MDR9482904.1 5-bromo-4-chloroindolyl phosphate hydrolysis family protein [Salibaculum sp.]
MAGGPHGGGSGPGAALDAGRRVDAAGARANLLFVPGGVLAFTALDEGATGLVLGLAGAAALTLAAWLTREGLRAQAAYDARRLVRRPALPRKILGAVLTGAGIGIAAFANGDGLVACGLFALAASGLHLAAFGPDPLRDKRVAGVDGVQQDRVARVVDEAEAYLQAMRAHVARLGDRRLEGRVMQFQATARRMIRTVEQDPRDLATARKFLGVYLMGARDATAKFAAHYARTGDAAARADFEALLADLEENFAARTEKMLLDDRSDMEVEIKVLRDRLQREGL